MDWDSHAEMNFSLLHALSSQNQRCLVIASVISPAELQQIEDAGALGYCFPGASPIQLASIIRNVAGGRRHFLFPESAMTPLSRLMVKRRPVFYRQRLEARALEVGWELRCTDISIIGHLDCESTAAIANAAGLQPGTVRTDLSVRIFSFLQLLSGQKSIKSQKTGFQVCLEYGIFEYQ